VVVDNFYHDQFLAKHLKKIKGIMYFA